MDIYEKYKNICYQLDHYPVDSELIYKYGFTREAINFVRLAKLKDSEYLKLNLPDELANPLLYWKHDKIIANFLGSHDLIRNSIMNQFADWRESEMLNGFLFSEIESSLAVEGIRSTRAQIEKLNKVDYDDLTETNDIIIKNMLLGYEFVKNNDITEENIFKLYSLLSKRCLKGDEQLLPGYKYRHDEVSIVDAVKVVVDKGINWKLLPKLMNELMVYINQEKTHEEHLLASHVIHFYMVYLHPYFDYNGRMARVMSFWYNIKHAPSLSLLLVSEAINNKIHKQGYYNAIMNSRKAGHDITYFLEYMGKIILKFSKIYINFYTIQNKLKRSGQFLNRSHEIALKNVLAIPVTDDGYFDWKDYKNFSHDDFSKQYYLKLLNVLVDLEILLVREHKKAKLFKLNINHWDLL
ncbi:MAG TPA: Fic family protein [Bacilli bacterium]|nr:Fic family protein [Bacilli bacterium]